MKSAILKIYLRNIDNHIEYKIQARYVENIPSNITLIEIVKYGVYRSNIYLGSNCIYDEFIGLSISYRILLEW